VIVNVINEQTALKISVDQVQQLVQQVIRKEGQICDEVNIYFVDSSAISQLHEQFFDDATPTDCISFPIDDQEGESHRLLGEVFICPAMAIAYAAKYEGDAYQETTLYIIHGLLHLMGYKDLEEQDIALMREAEAHHLQNLQSLNLQLQHPT
jgi:probable rRNA maturation factor